jgi:hypothetical protein
MCFCSLAPQALLNSHSTLGRALQHAHFVARFASWAFEHRDFAPEVF